MNLYFRLLSKITFFCLIISQLANIPLLAQSISLDNQRIDFVPKGFYIEDVTDERANTSSIGNVIINGRSTPINLTNGVRRELLRYFTANLAHNTKLQPMVLRIRDLTLTETAAGPSRIVGKCELKVEFAVRKDDQFQMLSSYQSGTNFSRPPKDYTLYESFIRKMMLGALQHFDNWITTNGSRNVALAKRVKVTFRDYVKNEPNSDTVFYSPSRPLVWSDFLRQAPPHTRYGAAVYTSIAYEARSRVINQQIELDITMKVFMQKSNSWALSSAKDPYALRHEQLHFDITKIAAEKFKQKILSEELPPDDYDSRIQYIYLEFFREMNQMQDQYDGETQHSIIRSEQQRWDKKVTAELKSLLEN